MKITKCDWELRNLNSKVAEVSIDAREKIDGNQLKDLECGYEYIVIKVPIARGDVYFELSKLGYTFIENQITFSKRFNDFEIADRIYKRTLQHVSVKKVSEINEAKKLLTRISDDMFITDRIYLDPYFGAKYAAQRYKYWAFDMFENGYSLYAVLYDEKIVGFTINKVNKERQLVVPLGGSFKDVSDIAIGPAPLLAIYKLKEEGLQFTRFITHVSSNNLPMVRVYNRLQFEQTHSEYVFVKHV